MKSDGTGRPFFRLTRGLRLPATTFRAKTPREFRDKPKHPTVKHNETKVPLYFTFMWGQFPFNPMKRIAILYFRKFPSRSDMSECVLTRLGPVGSAVYCYIRSEIVEVPSLMAALDKANPREGEVVLNSVEV